MQVFQQFKICLAATLLFSVLLTADAFSQVAEKEVNLPNKDSLPQPTVIEIDDLKIDTDELGLPWLLEVDAGTLAAGGEFEMRLSFKPDSDVSFAGYRTSCKCQGFTTEGNLWKSGEVSKGKLRFKAAGSTENGKSGLTVSFHRGGKSVGVISVVYEIAGNLFLESSRIFLVKDGLSEFLMPVDFTLPISESSIEFEGSDSFKDADVVMSIVTKNEQSFLSLMVDASMESDICTGEIVLKDSATGATANCSIVFAKQKPFVFSPSILTFAKNDDSGKWKSRAILKLNLGEARFKGMKQAKAKVDLSHLNAAPVQLKVKELTSNVYRLEFSCNEDVVPNDSTPVKLKIHNGDDAIETSVPFRFRK
jgi:hypothetical protein